MAEEQTPSGRERRQHERFDLLVEVGLHHGDHTATFSVINISAGGILLKNAWDMAFSIGDQIRVNFDVPELAIPFAIDARVIRVIQPTGKAAAIAAMWTSSDAAASGALGQLLWALSNR